MSEYRQPWRRVEVAGKRCRLQVLHPRAAFDLEPQLAARLGDAAALVVVAPGHVMDAIAKSAGAGSVESIRRASMDPLAGRLMATRALVSCGRLLSKALARMNLDGPWLRDAFASSVLGHLDVDGDIIEDARDWTALGLTWSAKWEVLSAQLRQTFGPLWTRSPYRVRSTTETHGVPEPKGVPIAVRYADTLAAQGHASSPREILREWTPVEMIEIIESAAYTAERERRAYQAARGDR